MNLFCAGGCYDKVMSFTGGLSDYRIGEGGRFVCGWFL